MRAPVILLFWSLVVACSEEKAVHDEHAHAKEAEHGDDGLVLTNEQIASSGIETAVTGSALIRTTLPLYGVIAPNAERVREVAARYPGAIRSVAKQVGDNVAQGERLAVVESNESLQEYRVLAPLDGVVTTRNANPGEQTGNTPLFTVADLSTVWVELALFPRDIGKVRVGQIVRVESKEAALAADGKVVYVAPMGSAANQTVTARVLLDNRDRTWAPGLYVTAEVTLGEVSVPIAVRNEALQTLDDRTVVFVRKNAAFEPHAFEIGRSDRDHTEVLGGIDAGVTYVTTNSFILKAELGKGEAGHEH